jgi:hypothetical protein
LRLHGDQYRGVASSLHAEARPGAAVDWQNRRGAIEDLLDAGVELLGIERAKLNAVVADRLARGRRGWRRR